MFNFLRKASRAGSLIPIKPGRPQWSSHNYNSLAYNGYETNVVAYKCIAYVAMAMSVVKWEVWRDGTRLTDGIPFFNNLQLRANHDQTFPEWVRDNVCYQLLAGECFEELLEVGGVPQELYALRPDKMGVVRNNSGRVARYIYKDKGEEIIYPVDLMNGKSLINHSKYFNPRNPDRGHSPSFAAGFAIDQLNEAMSTVQAIMQNGMIPSGAVGLDGDTIIGDDELNEVQARLDERFSGSMNSGRIPILKGGMSWIKMGFSPTEMGNLEIKASAARDVCMGFGVPGLLLGLPGDNTYANFSEARVNFWEDTIMPQAEHKAAAWSKWFRPWLPERAIIKPRFDHLPAMIERRSLMWSMIENASDLTINEGREFKGLPPIEHGDDVLVQSGKVPLSLLVQMVNDTTTPEDDEDEDNNKGYY
jgi:HK97 family phage portal protein